MEEQVTCLMLRLADVSLVLAINEFIAVNELQAFPRLPAACDWLSVFVAA